MFVCFISSEYDIICQDWHVHVSYSDPLYVVLIQMILVILRLAVIVSNLNSTLIDEVEQPLVSSDISEWEGDRPIKLIETNY